MIRVFKSIARDNRSVFCLGYLLFYIFFVLPLFVHTVYPFEYYSFIKANAAISDLRANIIYVVFDLVLSTVLMFFIKRSDPKLSKKKKYKIYIAESGKYVSKQVSNFCFMFIVFTFVLIIIKNGPGILFAGYGARLDNPSYEIFEPLITVSILFYTVLMIFSKDYRHSHLFFKKFLATILIILFIYMHGKRFIVAQFVILFVYLLFVSKRINGKQLLALCGISAVMVIGFAYLYGALFKNNTSSLGEYMLIDLSRHYTLMYQFYCEGIGRAISVNRFDAIIADLTAILPRSIWPDKPYPFSNSITGSLVGLSPSNENLGWSTTITYFSDLFDSFSYFGLIVGIAIMIFVFKRIDKTGKASSKALGFYVAINMFTVQFSAYIIPLLIFAVLVFFVNKLFREKGGTKPELVQNQNATCQG